MNKDVLIPVEQVKTVRGAQPQVTLFIDIENVDAVVADAGRVCGIVTEMNELLGVRIVAVQPSQTCRDPQVPLLILGDGIDPAIAQAVGRIGIGLIGFECIPVESVESILRTEPEEAAAILKNNVHGTLR